MSRILVRGQARSGTTITANFLSVPGVSKFSNELGIYDAQIRKTAETKKQFLDRVTFRLLSGGNKYIGLSHDDVRNIIGDLWALPEDISNIQMIKEMEKCFFSDAKIFGDKIPHTMRVHHIRTLRDGGIDFKAIYMYRDGRDRVASLFRRPKNPKRPTRTIREESKYWARQIDVWKNSVLKTQTEHLNVRFEDYIENTEEVLRSLSDFTEIDYDQIRHNFDRVFKSNNTHRGQHERYFDWEKEFHPEAIDMLKKLGYV